MTEAIFTIIAIPVVAYGIYQAIGWYLRGGDL